ncbi:hypothetical protein DM02DRAFT_614024 [Periconia macrospinosa]|uniref:Peptidase A1 domain-containing protein n=1 Tax=Periconia macrospinosa TaxID=97972 RepID=A0A2V1DSJ4_9PLEO|nr:hypothetical protein DM02DRAFT_614024 [Periconia macrospinosa]
MLPFLVLLVLSPLLVGANGIAEWQLPLSKHPGPAKCGRGRKGLHYGSAFSFFLNGDWRYYISDYFPGNDECNRGELTLLDMKTLDDISNRLAPKPKFNTALNTKKNYKTKTKPVSLMLTIPLGTEEEGPLIVEPDPAWKLFHDWDMSVAIDWTDSKVPGRALNITSIGVRQGATSASKTSKVPLNLGTPYMNIPNDMFDLLALSTKPKRTNMGRNMKPIETVDCAAINKFPNLVLEFDGGAFELVVKPEQYVLRVNEAMGGIFKGKCVLLVSRGGDMSIGWAALRGMSLWLDWQNARTGFGKPAR